MTHVLGGAEFGGRHPLQGHADVRGVDPIFGRSDLGLLWTSVSGSVCYEGECAVCEILFSVNRRHAPGCGHVSTLIPLTLSRLRVHGHTLILGGVGHSPFSQHSEIPSFLCITVSRECSKNGHIPLQCSVGVIFFFFAGLN